MSAPDTSQETDIHFGTEVNMAPLRFVGGQGAEHEDKRVSNYLCFPLPNRVLLFALLGTQKAPPPPHHRSRTSDHTILLCIRLCPSTAESSPLLESSNFLCPLQFWSYNRFYFSHTPSRPAGSIPLHLHLPGSLADRWGTTGDFTTNFLHSLRFSAFHSVQYKDFKFFYCRQGGKIGEGKGLDTSPEWNIIIDGLLEARSGRQRV